MKGIGRHIQISESLDLWVEARGSLDGEACLLINGAGANSSFWSDNLCNTIVERGFMVITYDHRDFGYSSRTDWDKESYDFVLHEFSITANAPGKDLGDFLILYTLE